MRGDVNSPPSPVPVQHERSCNFAGVNSIAGLARADRPNVVCRSGSYAVQRRSTRVRRSNGPPVSPVPMFDQRGRSVETDRPGRIGGKRSHIHQSALACGELRAGGATQFPAVPMLNKGTRSRVRILSAADGPDIVASADCDTVQRTDDPRPGDFAEGAAHRRCPDMKTASPCEQRQCQYGCAKQKSAPGAGPRRMQTARKPSSGGIHASRRERLGSRAARLRSPSAYDRVARRDTSSTCGSATT